MEGGEVVVREGVWVPGESVAGHGGGIGGRWEEVMRGVAVVVVDDDAPGMEGGRGFGGGAPAWEWVRSQREAHLDERARTILSLFEETQPLT